MELRQYFTVLIKWWWLIVAAMVIAGGAALAGSLTAPRTYQSRATLMVGSAMQNPNPNASEFSTGQALAQSYSDLVRREPVLRGALDALKLDWDWLALQGMVSSRVVPGTQLLEISVIDTNPQRAKVLTDAIVQQLIQQSPAGNNLEQESDRQFILDQIENLKTNIKQAQDEIASLDNDIAKATSVRQIQDARSRQDSLRSQVTSWQSTYAALSTNLSQGSTNFLRVVEPAQLGGAVGASMISNILLATAIGLVLASGAAFALEYLDDTIRTPEDINAVAELQMLGSVPRLKGEDYAGNLVTIQEPRSPMAEAYRMLRTNLQFSAIDRSLQALMVSSPSPAEGKSTTAANLSVVLASAGQRVILVDADLRRPVQHTIFQLSNHTGLTTILLDSNINLTDMLQATSVENLKVMTSGPIPPNPSELLGSKRMGYLIDALKSQSDTIIFDSPPIMSVADAPVLASRVDGVLLVVEWGRTQRSIARRSKDAIAAVGGTMLGVVLNRLPKRHEPYAYYYTDEERQRVVESSSDLLQRLRPRRNPAPHAKKQATNSSRPVPPDR